MSTYSTGMFPLRIFIIHRRLIAATLTVLWVVCVSFGQSIEFRPVNFPPTNYFSSRLIQSGYNAWAVSSIQGASIGLQDKQTWKEITRYYWASWVTAYCAFTNGSLATLRSNGDIEILTESGTELFNSIVQVNTMPAIISLDDSSLVVIAVQNFSDNIQGYIVTRNRSDSIVPFYTGNIRKLWLLRDSLCNSILLNIVSDTVGMELDTHSFILNKVQRKWEPMQNDVKASSIVNRNGMIGWLDGSGTYKLRRDCDDIDSIVSTNSRINQLTQLLSGELIGWVQSTTDTLSPLIFRSLDYGKSFVADSLFADVSGYVHGVV